jgi:hypothetical protein
MRRIHTNIDPKRTFNQYRYGNSLRVLGEVYGVSYNHIRNIIRSYCIQQYGYDLWNELAHKHKYKVF